jgi:hypothetical protein
MDCFILVKNTCHKTKTNSISASRDTCDHEIACVDAIYSIPRMTQKEGISLIRIKITVTKSSGVRVE